MKSDIELCVTDLARGGAGVARDESGRVIFIPYSAPGDRMRVQIVEEDKRYAQGEILEILEPSPIRVSPPCPVFGRCGGCQWQHLPYSLQWETKFKGVYHALARVGVDLPEQVDLIPANQIWNYRNRVQLRGFQEQLGFYRRGSQQLVPIDQCLIAREEINQCLGEVRKEGARFHKPYKVELEVTPSGEVRRAWNARHAAGGFRQVHDEQNEKLQQWIVSGLSPCDTLLDLFGGSGNLSKPLAHRSQQIHCVDLSVPRSSEPGLENLHFHRSPVLAWLSRKVAEYRNGTTFGGQTVSAILDPPREGLGRDFSEIALSFEVLQVNQFIAVGCDPDSWSRDVLRWVKKGWRLQKMLVIDLFPHTTHVESVALFERESTKR